MQNKSAFGIIDQNRSKEIPEMTRMPMSSPLKIVSGDVTKEYLEAAEPGRGTITYEYGYKRKVHQDEIRMADWLHRTFGGDIVLLKESKEPGDKTPDFLWNNLLWELKGATSKNSVDRAIREASKQIQSKPGGIILDVSTSDLPFDAIVDAINERIKRISLDLVDIMIVSNEKIKVVLRYKR